MAVTYNNTLGALNGIAGALETILANTSPKNDKQNSNGVQISDLSSMRGPVGSKPITEERSKVETKKVAISDVSGVSSVFAVIKASKGIKEKDAERVKKIFIEFGKGLQSLSKTMDNVNLEKINGIKNVISSLELIPAIVLKITALGIAAPLFTISAALLLPGFLILGKILSTLSKISNTDNIKNATSSLSGIGKFAVQMTIVTGLIVGLAFVVSKYKDTISEGIGITLGIYSGLILIASILMLASKFFTSAEPAFNAVGTFIARMLIVNALLITTALVTSLAKDMISEGIGITLGIYGGLILLASVIMLASKFFTSAEKALTSVGIFMMEIAVVTAMIVGIGMLVSNYKEESLIGFAAFTAILGEAAGLAALASKLKPTVEKGANALFTIGKFMFMCVGVVAAVVGLGMLIKVVSEGDYVTWGSIGLAIAGMSFVILSAFGLAKLAQKVKSSADKGARAMLSSAKVILAAAGCVAAIIALSMFMQKSNVTWKDLGMTLAGMSGVLVAVGGLSLVASKIGQKAKKGAAGLLLTEVVIGGSLALVFGIAKLSKYVTETLGGWSDIFVCLGAMAAVVTAFGVLAAAAGMIAGQIAIGGAVLLECEVVAGASLLVLLGMVKTVEAVKQLGDPNDENSGAWAQIFVCLGAMASVVAAFGVLAGAAGLIAPIIAIGGAVLLECSMAALASAQVVISLVSVVNAVKKLDAETGGKGWETINNTVDNINTNVLTKFESLAKKAALSAGSIREGSKALSAVSEMALSTNKVIINLIALHNILKEHPVTELTNIATNISAIMLSYAGVSEEIGDHAIKIWAGCKSLKSVVELSHSFSTVIADLVNTNKILADTGIETLTALSNNIGLIVGTYATLADDIGRHARRIRNGAESITSIIDLSHSFNTLITELNNTPAIHQDTMNSYFTALDTFIVGLVTPITEIKRLNAAKQVHNFDKALSGLIKSTLSASTKKNINSINSMSNSIMSLGKSLKEFDDGLLRNSDTRINAINNLKNSINKLTDTFNGNNGEKGTKFLNALKDVLREIQYASPNKVDNVLAAITKLNKTASKGVVEKATDVIANAVKGVVGGGGSGEIDYDMLTNAIEAAVARGIDNTQITFTTDDNKTIKSAWIDSIDNNDNRYTNMH